MLYFLYFFYPLTNSTTPSFEASVCCELFSSTLILFLRTIYDFYFCVIRSSFNSLTPRPFLWGFCMLRLRLSQPWIQCAKLVCFGVCCVPCLLVFMISFPATLESFCCYYFIRLCLFFVLTSDRIVCNLFVLM